MLPIPKQSTLKSILPIPKQSILKSILPIPEQSNPKSMPPILASVLLVIQLAIIKTAYSQARSSNNQLLLDKLEFLKSVDLDKVQIFKIMPQDEMKGQYNKQLKSSYKIFINILFKDINNDPNLIYIREINFNYIWEHRYFNASINPISTNKELKDKYKNKVEKVKQEVNYLKDV